MPAVRPTVATPRTRRVPDSPAAEFGHDTNGQFGSSLIDELLAQVLVGEEPVAMPAKLSSTSASPGGIHPA